MNTINSLCKTLTPLSLSLLLLSGCQSGNPVREADQGPDKIPAGQDSVQRMVQLAATIHRKGDHDSAIAMYRRALLVSPTDVAALAGLGQTYLATRQNELAERTLRQALDHAPANPDIVLAYGQSLLRRGQANTVVSLVGSHLARPGEHPPEMYNLNGLARDRLGQHQQAEQSYREGLKREPGSFSLRNNLAYCLMLQGDYEQARDLLQVMVEEKGGHARHRQNLALAYGLAGQADKAASIARLDLGLSDVERNLAYYRWLRELPRPVRHQALLGQR